jgi:cyanophycinase
VWETFIRLAGGPQANFVFVPTADGAVDLENLSLEQFPFDRLKHVTVLHTRCRSEADSEAFVAPLRKATGVWFGSGRQFRLIDSYLHTRFQRELKSLLRRGGVIGGWSAGGVVLASKLVHSAILDQRALVTKGYDEGFGLLAHSVIDQRVGSRHKEAELSEVVEVHPELVGLGLDESTSILVRGDILEVIGPGRLTISDNKEHAGKKYHFLKAGDRFNLRTRSQLGRTRNKLRSATEFR